MDWVFLADKIPCSDCIFSQCSTQCGLGIRTRTVVCQAVNGQQCLQSTRPQNQEVCDMGPCSSETPSWFIAEWSQKVRLQSSRQLWELFSLILKRLAYIWWNCKNTNLDLRGCRLPSIILFFFFNGKNTKRYLLKTSLILFFPLYDKYSVTFSSNNQQNELHVSEK